MAIVRVDSMVEGYQDFQGMAQLLKFRFPVGRFAYKIGTFFRTFILCK